MNIFNFSAESDRDELRKRFFDHFRKSSFVPFFGSGFSKGHPANKGVVPSVNELRSKLINITAKIENYEDDDCEALRSMPLYQLSDLFWSSLESNSTDERYQNEFSTYIDNNFRGVHDLPMEHQELVNCRWRYLYTFNYDDAIEESAPNTFEVIYPYCQQNKKWLEGKRCLYKIHGDAKQYVTTGNKQFCILSTQQYLSALNDDQNMDMLEKLEADFSSNNIIFFGCSLLDEIDMLFAAGTKLSAKKKANTDTHIYYVRYINNDTPQLNRIDQQRFAQYAITDIINVNAEDFPVFYSFIASISQDASNVLKSDDLSNFMGFSFSKLDQSNRKNIEYLFYSEYIYSDIKNKSIILPSFFVRRNITEGIIRDIMSSTGHFHVLRGGRLSGKTYVLIDLLKEFQLKDTYYFYSSKNISKGCFERLISIKNAILIFDEHTLTIDQIAEITKTYRRKIEENRIHIVIAIDRSAGVFTNHYFDAYSGMESFVRIYSLPSKLDNYRGHKELDDFNKEFGKLGLLDYKRGLTLLDFMIKVDEASTKKYRNQLPNTNIIQNKNILKALILLANQGSIPISQGNIMGVEEALYELCKTADIAIQKDYLTEAEFAPNIHDSFRFVANSKYWIYKCLSVYANNPNNYDSIADTFYDIVKSLQRHYGYEKNKHVSNNYYQAVKPYYFLDTIQFMFFSCAPTGGSLTLSNKIYTKLLPVFKDEFQFLHQKAKCLLWNSKRTPDINKKARVLNEALQQIARAYDLATQSNAFNVEYTLYHMDVTRTLIMVNNWRYCRTISTREGQSELLSQLLASFYKLEQNIKSGDKDTELDDQEMKDIQWFVNELGSGKMNKLMSHADKRIAGKVLTLAIQKRIGQYPD